MAKNKKQVETTSTVGGRTRQEWNREAHQLWKRMRKFYNRNNGDGRGVENYDFIEAMMNRRNEALRGSLQEIYDRYQERYSELFPRETDLGDDWIDLNIHPCNYTEVDNECYLLHGAVIWMLDRIMEHDALRREMYLHLPRDDSFMMEVDWPDIWDSQHSVELIDSLHYVLYSRNKDAGGLEDTPAGARRLTDKITAERKQHVDVKSRQNFEAIVDLLPKEDIELAIQHYEEYFWQWTDRYFNCIAPMQKEIVTLWQEIDDKDTEFTQMQAEQKEISKILDKKLKERRKEQRSKKSAMKDGNPLFGPKLNTAGILGQDSFSYPVTSPLTMAGQYVYKGVPVGGSVSFLDDPDMQRLKKLEDRMVALAEELEEKSDRLQELRHKKYQFMGEIVHMGRISSDTCKERYGDDVAANMTQIHIRDPYEACFALLYMIDNDYDLPWIYGAGVGIAQEIGESLPWGVIQYDETDDELWYAYIPRSDEEESEESQKTAAEMVKPVEMPDWYERKYHPKKGEFDFPRSLAQMLYEETGCLMPRDLHRYDGKMKLLREHGLRGKDAVTMLTCMNALGNARRIGSAMNFDPQFMHYLEVGEEAYFAEKEQPQAETENLPERVTEQQKEIKRLRDALHSAEKANREIYKDLESERKAFAMERRELADLRELVFNRENEEEQPTSNVGATFPYEVQKDTLIFGGHDTWEKAIKPMLAGNVRFISKELTFDTAIVRHAEVIWIQTNAISHTQYYRVVDTARQYKKPVRYFTNASAEKCAFQVMENDETVT